MSRVPLDEQFPAAPREARSLQRPVEALMAPPLFSAQQLPRYAKPRNHFQQQAALANAPSGATKRKAERGGERGDGDTGGGRPAVSAAAAAAKRSEMEALRERVLGAYHDQKLRRRDEPAPRTAWVRISAL